VESGRVCIAVTLTGFGYMVFRDWLNADLRQSWTYAAAMPRFCAMGNRPRPTTAAVAAARDARSTAARATSRALRS